MFCGRCTGQQAGFAFLGRTKDDLWGLYRVDNDQRLSEPKPARVKERVLPDLGEAAARYAKALTLSLKNDLAVALKLPTAGIDAIPLIGWNGTAWTFPEVDASGKAIGISRRYRDGTKRAIAGSARGLTVPKDWKTSEGPILIVEGPSDTMAAHCLGFASVGRPSNTGGVEFLAQLLKDVSPSREIAVIGENDRKPNGLWPGRDGAMSTSARLKKALRRDVSFFMTPDGAKDIRSWAIANAKADWIAAGNSFYMGL